VDAAADQRAVIGGSVRAELLCDIPCEFPRINYDTHNARPYRYLYGAGPPLPDMLPQGASDPAGASQQLLSLSLCSSSTRNVVLSAAIVNARNVEM
jgi:hypothetical protein